MQTILDVGCGISPWLIRGQKIGEYPWLIRKRRYRTGQVVYAGISNNQSCVCIDTDTEALTEARRFAEEVRTEYTDQLIEGKLFFLKADGTNILFPDCSFDVVVLSDVLSSPYVLTSDKDKMILECIRVLRPNGHLIVTVYQTPQFATWATSTMNKKKNLRIQQEFLKSEVIGFDMCNPVFGTMSERVYSKSTMHLG